jgi:hypothetical protein
MKLNEAKFRSPEWLRNFVDFEVNTGDDISGAPSKRKAAKLEKEKQDKLRAEAKKRAEAREKAEKERKEQQDRYKAWRKQADEREQQEKIERDLNTLYRSIISDFTSARYSDKISTPQRNGKTAFYYTFENGKVIRMYKSATDNRYQLESETHIYTLGSIWSGKFIDLANEMIKKGTIRPTSGRSGYDRYDSYGGSRSSSGSSGSSGSSSGQRKADNTPPKWRDHPKGGMYQTLKDTVKLREEQLKKATGTDKEALQNELNAAKRMLDNLNKKYNFESNIQSFIQFHQIFEKSKFVEVDEFNELLDKINDTGLTSLTDIEKKRLDLFSMDDEPILDLIDRMAEISVAMRSLTKIIKDLSDKGESDKLDKALGEWKPLDTEITKLENIIEEYGIDLGDETFMSMMNKQGQLYGWDPYEDDNDELETDM